MIRRTRSRLVALLIVPLSFGLFGCSPKADPGDISRIQSQLQSAASGTPGVASSRVTYSTQGATGSLEVNGTLTMASADRQAATQAAESFFKATARVVPDTKASRVAVFVNASDKSFQVSAKDLGFVNASPSFSDVIAKYGR